MPCTNLICSGGLTTPDIISGFHSLELDRSSKKITEHRDDLWLGMDTSGEEISFVWLQTYPKQNHEHEP